MKTEYVDNLTPTKIEHGVTPDLAGCHTAVVEGYVIEGHVPAREIHRLLEERPDIAHNLTLVRHETLIRWFEGQGATRSIAENLAGEGFRVFYEERQKVEPYPGTVATLEILSKDYPMGAITNGNADLMAMPLGQYFQFCLQAQHFTKPKPDPAMFEEALKKLNVEPHECLHIGDDIEHDIMGAKHSGMRAVWFNTRAVIPEGDVPADHTITTLEELISILKLPG